MKENNDMTKSDKLDDLFDIIKDLSIGMLVSENANELRSRPMKAFPDTTTNQIWFLTKLGSPKIREIAKDSDVNVSFACPKSQQYVSISGKAFVSRDMEKIDMMWSDDMALWFDCEKTDPNVAAIRIVPSVAEYWDGKSSKIARMWEIAKAKVKGDTPDLGDNETVRMAS
jgi:general stress protein 26